MAATTRLSRPLTHRVPSLPLALSPQIAAGDAWRLLYDTTEDAVKARGERENTGRTWDLDRSSIFAQIDAFVQRCRDLQEVCEGQTQFARKAAGGTTGELPVFGGARGAEVSSQLLAIQTTFEKHVATLRALNYDILDVKATRWHDDYNAFKVGAAAAAFSSPRLLHVPHPLPLTLTPTPIPPAELA